MRRLSKKDIVLISFMLFSMFFGAGNLIFPPSLGRSAGEYVWLALAGFIASAVGLPILGVIAVAKANGFDTLANRVHPKFAIIFPFIIYLSIGPGLAIPRAGSLAYEMGVRPFLPAASTNHSAALFVYTLLFFSVVCWFSLSPLKLIDRFGKCLTPLLLLIIFAVFIKSFISPMDSFSAPTGNYSVHPAFQGFLDGYLTMDALAALVYGIVVSNTIRSKGVDDDKKLSHYMIYAGLGAGSLLTIIYVILGYLGASSVSFGKADNGAQILTNVMNHLFGQSGALILGIVFTVACLCVSIALVTSCSQFFSKTFPMVPYKVWAMILCVVSMLIANLGLTQILTISVPILGLIYPIAIVLIALSLSDRYLKGKTSFYISTVVFVGVFSIIDTINKSFLSNHWNPVLVKLPLYSEGVGWLLPAIVGLLIGFLFRNTNSANPTKVKKESYTF